MVNSSSILIKYCNLGFLLWFTCAGNFVKDVTADFSYETVTTVLSRISIAYTDPVSQSPRSFTAEIGRFASSTIRPAGGLLKAALAPARHNNPIYYSQGCIPNWLKEPKTTPWVALLQQGGCSDIEKVRIALAQNASAVLIFGNDHEAYFRKDLNFEGDIVVVYLLQSKGEQLTALLRRGVAVYLSIGVGQEVKFRITNINRTSILFVSVSFMVLMVVSLAWLVFYYIQRFRYINAKDRLAKHLSNAAKKALNKIPMRIVKTGDAALAENESCAVCIDNFQVSDNLRSLPCKHEFHKNCVDSWLLEHRTCPMCKMDILKYYGYCPVENSGSEINDDIVVVESGLENGAGIAQRSTNSASPRRGSNQDLQVSVIACADTTENDDIPSCPPSTVENSSTGPKSPQNSPNSGAPQLQSVPSSQTQPRSASSIFRGLISTSSQISPQNSSKTCVEESNILQEKPVNKSFSSNVRENDTIITSESRYVDKESTTDSVTEITEKERPLSSNTQKITPLIELKKRSQSYEVVPLVSSEDHSFPSTNTTNEQNFKASSDQIVSQKHNTTKSPTDKENHSSQFSDILQDVFEDSSQYYNSNSSSQSNFQLPGACTGSDYDLERLVREIDELEREQYLAEQPEVPLSSSSTSKNTFSPIKRGSLTAIAENNPQSPFLTDLTEVVCDPPMQFKLESNKNDSLAGKSSATNRRISTIDLDEDEKELNSNRRKSSSHIISITHS